MSASWMGYFFDDTDLEDSLLLLALAIGDHANAEGQCWPGVELLAKKIRKSPRQTKLLLSKLQARGHVDIVRGKGRGHFSKYQLKKVLPVTPFIEPEKVTQPQHLLDDIKGVTDSTLSEDKRCYPASGKGVTQRLEKVLPSVYALKEEPSIEPKTEPVAAKPPTTHKPSDPRKDPPAIVAIREIAEIYPNKVLWDDLINILGTDPDIEKLRRCYVAWVGKGFRPVNFAWATEWYAHGIPAEAYRGIATSRNSDVGRWDGVDDSKVVPPCAKCGSDVCLGGRSCSDRAEKLAKTAEIGANL